MTLEETQDTMLGSISFVKDFAPSFFSKSLKDVIIDFSPSTWETRKQQFLFKPVRIQCCLQMQIIIDPYLGRNAKSDTLFVGIFFPD